MSLFERSNEQAILNAVTAELVAAGFKVPCQLGVEDDAFRGSPPRITWVPDPKALRGYTHPAQQFQVGKVGHEKQVTFAVHVWGANYTEASALENALIAALYQAFSPNAYELLGGSTPEPETPGEGTGYCIVMAVRLLRIPVVVEPRLTAPALTSATATGEVGGPSGSNQIAQAAPSIAVSY